MVDKELLEILVCPKCKADIEYTAEDERITCQSPECGLRYPVRDGIPIMLIDEADDPLASGDGDS
ncbi:MAG TPA: Trm112 family protein [Armatimonadota bacterium]|nr:Trm112 family protein [Armatimonadota bacterium]